MRCDKCGKRIENDWTPQDNWPKYDITQRCGVLYHITQINLCDKCSQKLKEWLEEENETDRCG